METCEVNLFPEIFGNGDMDLASLYHQVKNEPGWDAEDLDSLAEDLEFVAKQLRDGAKAMREKPLHIVHLKGETAFGDARRAMVSLGSKIASQIREQFKCSQDQTVPSWIIHKLKKLAPKYGATVRQILEAAEVVSPAISPLDAIEQLHDQGLTETSKKRKGTKKVGERGRVKKT